MPSNQQPKRLGSPLRWDGGFRELGFAGSKEKGEGFLTKEEKKRLKYLDLFVREFLN